MFVAIQVGFTSDIRTPSWKRENLTKIFRTFVRHSSFWTPETKVLFRCTCKAKLVSGNTKPELLQMLRKS